MSYLSSDEEIHPLTENFQLTYAQLERDYDGTLVILLRAEIDTVTSRIEALEEKLDHIIQEVEDLRKQKTLIV
jgi:transcription initiation factor IIF auxiliary subunit